MANPGINAKQSVTPVSRVKGSSAPTGGVAVSKSGTGYTTAPGQGPGPKLQGGDNEMSSAIPGRILQTRVVRRASHSSGMVSPSKLVNYSRGFGSK